VRNSFACGKPEFTNTIFPIIPGTTYPRSTARLARPLLTGPGNTSCAVALNEGIVCE